MTRALTAVTLLTLIAGGCQAPPAPAATEPAANGAAPATAPVGTTNAAAPAPPPAPTTIEVTVPEGTPLSVELLTSLSTKTAAVETPIRGRLRKAVEVNDRVVLPAGSELAGVVTASERPGRTKGRGQLSLRFTSITVGDERLALKSSGITFRGKDERKKDAVKIGGGAGIGAVIGGLIGGGDGAAKGAAIGGAAGTGAVLATRGGDAAVAAGTTLSAEITAPLTVTVPR